MAISAIIQKEDGKEKITLDGTVITDCVLLEKKENSAYGYDLLLRVSVKRITEGRPGAWLSYGCIPAEHIKSTIV